MEGLGLKLSRTVTRPDAPGQAGDRLAVLLLLAVMLAGAIARLYLLEGRTMGHIEIYTPGIPLPEGISEPARRMGLIRTVTGSIWEVHPPSWYISILPWTRLLGPDLFTMRLPSVIAGVAAIPLAYLVGKREWGRNAGLICAALIALNGHHLLWSQVSRPYTASVVIGLATTLLLLKVTEDGGRRRGLLWFYAAATVYGLSTIYYYWLLFAAQMLWVLIGSSYERAHRRGLLRLQFLALILATPVVTLALFQSRSSYLDTEGAMFLTEYLSFGFLMEQDVEAGMLIAGAIRTALLVTGATLLVAGIASGLRRPRRESAAETTAVAGPANIWLFAASAAAFAAIMVSAAVYSRYIPPKTTALFATGALPFIMLGAAFISTQVCGRSSGRAILPGVPLTAMLAVVPLVMVLAISAAVPFIATRGMLTMTPYLLMTIAGGMVAISALVGRFRKAFLIVILAPLLAVHLLSVRYSYSRPISPVDYAGLASAWVGEIRPDDLIFLEKHWATTPVFYYLSGDAYNFVATDYSGAVSRRPGARVWTLSTDGLPVTDAMKGALAGYTPAGTIEARRVTAALYRPPAHGPSFATCLGGKGDGTLWEAALDSTGNIVVTGYGYDFTTENFPGARVIGTPSGESIVVASFRPDGTRAWMTIIGGSGLDEALGLALDPADNIYIAGMTSSTDLPTTEGAFDRTNNGGGTDCNGPHGCNLDAFAMKLSPDGNSLVYSTYIGGSGEDAARGGVAVGADGSAYLTGFTSSTDLAEEGPLRRPLTANHFNGGKTDGFIVKLSPDGSSVVYLRYIGGSEDNMGEAGIGIAVDPAGRAHVHAIVRSVDAETTPGAHDPNFNGGASDAYIVRLSADGGKLEYATYFGGSGDEFAEHGIAIGPDGSATMTGYTDSPDLPVTTGSAYGGAGDGYLVRFDSNGHLRFSAYIVGAGREVSTGTGAAPGGGTIVTGWTGSRDFEVTGDVTGAGGDRGIDAFVRLYGKDGSLEFSTTFGGSGKDRGRNAKFTPSGRAVVVGSTASADFPVTGGALAASCTGDSDGFLAVIDVPGRRGLD